jgi:hypothetical protein
MLSFTEACVVLNIFISAELITSAAFCPHLGVNKASTLLSTIVCAAFTPEPPVLSAAVLSINSLSLVSVS